VLKKAKKKEKKKKKKLHPREAHKREQGPEIHTHDHMHRRML